MPPGNDDGHDLSLSLLHIRVNKYHSLLVMASNLRAMAPSKA